MKVNAKTFDTIRVCDTTTNLIDSLYMGAPTSDHLSKIHKIMGDKSTTEEDWFVCCVYASDNLIDRSSHKWHTNVIDAMQRRGVGARMLVNHDWHDVGASVGFVYDSFIQEHDKLPRKQVVGMESYNKEVMVAEGYKSYNAWVAIATDKNEIINSIQKNRISDISTGGLIQKIRYICPLCSKEYSAETGVFDLNEEGKFICPHTLPGWGWWSREEEYEMPYVIVDGNYDVIENSFVNSPNLPNCHIHR